MTIAEMIRQYQARLADAERVGATAPLASVYALVLDDLRALAPTVEGSRMLTAAQAAQRLGLRPKTITNWAGLGRLPGAVNSSSEGGVWLVPSSALPHVPRRPRTGWTKPLGRPSI